ncbi:MAG: hypothetical protein VYA54_02020 [Bdellovibrionota bacterium]|nr:hypothetical protein [Bdellovibrionota bacterium]
MKSQKHNEGETAELKVNIEKQLIADLETMSKNSDLPVEELVAIAIKRFRSSHADYMGIKLDFP